MDKNIETYNKFLEMNTNKTKKIGFDIHGVISTDPELFRELSKAFKSQGYEIHIITGPRLEIPYKTKTGNYNSVKEELDDYGIIYDELFSVLDYNISLGVDAWEDENGWWTSDESWNKTKGEYAKRENLDLHIDDTKIYGEHFTTPFAHLTPVTGKPRTLELKGISENDDIIQTIKEVTGDNENPDDPWFFYKEI
jgi:hypothetical protein